MPKHLAGSLTMLCIVVFGNTACEKTISSPSCEQSHQTQIGQWIFTGPKEWRDHCREYLPTKMNLHKLASALDIYQLDNFHYPSTQQGLKALIEKPKLPPEPRNYYHDGYIKRLPKDARGSGFVYKRTEGRVSITSFGADGIAGGQGTNCLLYTSPSPRDATLSRMPSSA